MLPSLSRAHEELLQHAWRRATPEQLGRLILDGDLVRRHIPEAATEGLVAAALDDGLQIARLVCERYADDPAAIAARLGIAVRLCDGDGGYASTLVYAEYLERPPGIRLFRPILDAINRCLRRTGLQSLAGIDDVAPVFLAHELYHHFDCARGAARLSKRYPVTLLSLGRWHWRSGVATLPEIAAGAFAQRLLRLDFHPKLLDLLALLEVAPECALRLAERFSGLEQSIFEPSGKVS